jgi:hypothetical protein
MESSRTPDPSPSEFEKLVLSASRRGAPGSLRLDHLLDRCWPSGGDRTVPAAVAWVREWGPARAAIGPLECGCRAGRCAVCN